MGSAGLSLVWGLPPLVAEVGVLLHGDWGPLTAAAWQTPGTPPKPRKSPPCRGSLSISQPQVWPPAPLSVGTTSCSSAGPLLLIVAASGSEFSPKKREVEAQLWWLTTSKMLISIISINTCSTEH